MHTTNTAELSRGHQAEELFRSSIGEALLFPEPESDYTDSVSAEPPEYTELTRQLRSYAHGYLRIAIIDRFILGPQTIGLPRQVIPVQVLEREFDYEPFDAIAPEHETAILKRHELWETRRRKGEQYYVEVAEAARASANKITGAASTNMKTALLVGNSLRDRDRLAVIYVMFGVGYEDAVRHAYSHLDSGDENVENEYRVPADDWWIVQRRSPGYGLEVDILPRGGL